MLQRLLILGINSIQKCEVRDKHVCFLVQNKSIISMKFNCYGPLQNGVKTTYHAEECILSQKLSSKCRRKNIDLYVFRFLRYKETDTWVLVRSKPCNHCIDLIKKFNIRKVYYSEHEGIKRGIIVCKSKYLHNDHVTIGRLSLQNKGYIYRL